MSIQTTRQAIVNYTSVLNRTSTAVGVTIAATRNVVVSTTSVLASRHDAENGITYLWRRRGLDERRVVQGALRLVGCLKRTGIAGDVAARQRPTSVPLLEPASFNPLPQHVEWRIDEVQLDGCASTARHGPQSVPLRPPPCSPLDDHMPAQAQQTLRQCPLDVLDAVPCRRVEQVDAYADHPVVGGEPNCVELALKSQRGGGLSGPR